MLKLTRHVGDSILIGKDILITVVELHGNQVRLGILAPEDIKVVRTELLDKQPQDQDRFI